MRRRTARAVLLAVTAALAVTVLPATGATKAPGKTRTPTPSYTTYTAPTALGGNRAGEPSVGANWKTGALLLQASLRTLKLTGAGSTPTWADVSGSTSAMVSLDPIAFTDSRTGRTFVSQLLLAGSLMEFTDDDGRTWTQSQGAGVPAGVDHQTVGGGPYPPEAGAGPLTSYPHAVYYCSQDLYTALCARSDTGGLTFGPGVPMYTFTQCGGLHGHVKVAPDGTVYVPNSGCNGKQGVAVSRDAGNTWTVRTIPRSSEGNGDPSIAIARDGTLYQSFDGADGHQYVAVSRDRGLTWTEPLDIGRAVRVQSSQLTAAVAGDGDRAAVAFLGTTTEGDDQDPDFGKDENNARYVGASYHLFIATTYDRGATWKTVDVTGRDPVQRGRICMGGVGCSGGDRNLLDFFDATLDRDGRVVVAWADGCTGSCTDSDLVAHNNHSRHGALTRQSGGMLLYRSPQGALR